MEHINLFQFGQAGSLREARLMHFADAEKPKAETEKVEDPSKRLEKLFRERVGAIEGNDEVQVRIEKADEDFKKLKEEHKEKKGKIETAIKDVLEKGADRDAAILAVHGRTTEILSLIDGANEKLSKSLTNSDRPYNVEIQYDVFLKWLAEVQAQAAQLNSTEKNKEKAVDKDKKALEDLKKELDKEKGNIESASADDSTEAYRQQAAVIIARFESKLRLAKTPAEEKAVRDGIRTLTELAVQKGVETGKTEVALDKKGSFLVGLQAERNTFDAAVNTFNNDRNKGALETATKTVLETLEKQRSELSNTDESFFEKQKALATQMAEISEKSFTTLGVKAETRVGKAERELKALETAQAERVKVLTEKKEALKTKKPGKESVDAQNAFKSDLDAEENKIITSLRVLRSVMGLEDAPFNAEEQIDAQIKNLQALKEKFRGSDTIGANKPVEASKVDGKATEKPGEATKVDGKSTEKPGEATKVEKKEEVKPLPDSLKDPTAALNKALEKEKNKLDPKKWAKETLDAKAALDKAFKNLTPEQRKDALPAVQKEFAGYIVTETDGTLNFAEKPKDATAVDRSKFSKDQLDILDKMDEGMMKEILKVLFVILNSLKNIQVDQLKAGKVEGKLGEEPEEKKKAQQKIDDARKQASEATRVGGLTAPQETALNQQLRQQEARLARLEQQERAVNSAKAALERRFGDQVVVDVRDGQMFIRGRNGLSAEDIQIRMVRASNNDRRMLSITERMTFRGDTVGFSERDTANIVLNNPTFNINVINAAEGSRVAAVQGTPGRARILGGEVPAPATKKVEKPGEATPVKATEKPAEATPVKATEKPVEATPVKTAEKPVEATPVKPAPAKKFNSKLTKSGSTNTDETQQQI